MRLIKLAFGADHAGFPVKSVLIPFLMKEGYKILDVGTNSEASTDYPDYARRVGKAVASGRCDKGILICGTGVGMAMAANKVRGVRAGVAWSVPVAKLVAQHNWTNVLCLGARFSSPDKIKKMVLAWLKTPHDTGGRHERRIKKIAKIEAEK